ncbi:histidine phosphatase family protein [Paenibacillus allorhizosphaerae]|uniref:histidine phosphatase family protein n=1 Tax=Paenibacillus allorhizosphaerae TaxID=2849866 RepID=UPI001C4019A0|nr:histidine phosphatase family protein [Paenibacillus allorhizosphaerae]
MDLTSIICKRKGRCKGGLSGFPPKALWTLAGINILPLTPLGVSQAGRLGEALRDVHFDVIYTSSSGSARQTAELVRGLQSADIIACDELQEIDMGQGRLYSGGNKGE